MGWKLIANHRQCDSRTADSDAGGMGGMMQDLAFAIPGIDEAMGFAEVMKYVRLPLSSLAGHLLTPSCP